MVLSNDSHGDLLRRRINEGLTRGALVHCGFDNDAGGNKLWQQVKGAYPRAGAIERRGVPARRGVAEVMAVVAATRKAAARRYGHSNALRKRTALRL